MDDETLELRSKLYEALEGLDPASKEFEAIVRNIKMVEGLIIQEEDSMRKNEIDSIKAKELAATQKEKIQADIELERDKLEFEKEKQEKADEKERQDRKDDKIFRIVDCSLKGVQIAFAALMLRLTFQKESTSYISEKATHNLLGRFIDKLNR